MSAPYDSIDVLEQAWSDAELAFAANRYHGRPDGDRWRIEPRDPRFLLTAVHGVRHFRPGRGPKTYEFGTGGLAVALSATLGWSVALIGRADVEAPDANYDSAHPFKAALVAAGLASAGSVLVDLHGMSDRFLPVELSVGLAQESPTSVGVARAIAASAERFDTLLDLGARVTGLTGRHHGSMTYWAQERGAAAVQLEVAAALRRPQATRDSRHRLLRILIAACTEIAAS